MFLHLPKRGIAVVVTAVALLLPWLFQPTHARASEGLQLEFPAGGELRIENAFGSVYAESWKQKYIFISTTDDSGSTAASVIVENKNQGLVVRVARRQASGSIGLTVRLPETARVEIVTGSGEVSLRGVPSSATVKSVGGNVKVGFLEPANADIVATAPKGFVKSELPQLASDNGHVLQARVGAGSQTLRLSSETGNILLSQVAGSVFPASPELRADDLNNEGPRQAAGTPAPTTDTQDVSEGDVIRVDSQLVALNVSVVDRNTKRGMVGLQKSDFKLFENGAEQEILQFESSSAPFDLILLIDLSGSTRDVVNIIRAAALRFVDAARPSDRIGVITFAGSPLVVSPPTSDRQLLHQRLNAMDTAAGDTKLYDSLDFTLSQSLKDTRNARRTAIILMSDGLDNNIPGVQGDGSKLQYKDVLNRIGEFDGVLYTLWLNTVYESLSPLDTQPEAFDAGFDRMKEMADVGGGAFYPVEGLEDLAGAYDRVVADLGTVYSLAYRPSDKTRDGKWRAIKLNVVTHPAAIARGKRGYYAN
ncbi:MAG TPA: VWA domain-containing protein [Pyrinomonadaceae bacterium]|nr:VWA domain-containing protein [Pyrinomonadaceae bacterium]